MEIKTDRSVLDKIPAERKANYHINSEATIHITRILRNMYQDPPRAVVREYISNSIDVHREHNVQKPIEVSLPNRFTQTFRVRDFGPGLLEAEVEKLLLGYGSSGDHKRKSNEQIGGFGIGCKCAFAVSDTFTYVSWRDGYKQTWICQLDDKDMGEAKLISKVKSDEPSGLMIEIPIRDSQIAAFEKQTKLALRFINVPISVDGKIRQPDNIFDVHLHGPLNGNFKGSTRQFLNFKDTSESSTDLLAVMGDMWYPIDPEQVKGLDASKLQKVLKGSNGAKQLACAFRIPIGSLSIAPTREGLQYDAHTCKHLKHIVNDVDRVLQEQAESLIEQETTQFNALDKAFEMKARKVFTFPMDKQHGPYINWSGRKLFLKNEFAIPAVEHASGAVLRLMTRDTFEDNGGRRYSYRNSGPCVSKLATHEVVLTSPHAISSYPSASITTTGDITTLTEKPGTMYSSYNYNSRSNVGGKSIPIVAYAPKSATSNSHATESFVFMRRLKLYTTIPGVPTLFYARKMLKANQDKTVMDKDGNRESVKAYAPYEHGMFLVLEGTPEQRKAFLQDYPWLIENPNDVEELPVAESALKRAAKGLGPKGTTCTPKARKRPNYELFKFNRVISTHAPSENWDRVAKDKLPDDDYYGVFMSRMNPVPVDKPIDGLQPSNQFRWLTTAQAVMSKLKGKDVAVHGIRLYQTHTPKIPDEFVNFYDAMKVELDKWFDPATIGQYAVHGTQILTRFGHDNHIYAGSDSKHYRNIGSGIFEEFDFEDDQLPFDLDARKKKSRYGGYGRSDQYDHQVHLMDCVRIPESWKLIKATCKPDSELVRWGEELEVVLGPASSKREKELKEWHDVMSEFARACDYASPRDKHGATHEITKARAATLKANLEPTAQAWQKVWNHYACLRLFEDVPTEGDDLKGMLEYIQVIDSK